MLASFQVQLSEKESFNHLHDVKIKSDVKGD